MVVAVVKEAEGRDKSVGVLTKEGFGEGPIGETGRGEEEDGEGGERSAGERGGRVGPIEGETGERRKGPIEGEGGTEEFGK